MKKIISLIIIAFYFSLSQVPSTISYQGQLLDNLGNPVSNGNTTATFSLYDASENGNEVWVEVQTFETNNGIFNVELGSSNPLTSLNFDNPLWLEILIEEGGSPLSPRIELTANPFSRNVSAVIGAEINNTQIGNSTASAATFTTTETGTLTITGNSISASSSTLSISSVDFASSTIYIPNSVSDGAVLTSNGIGNASWENIPAGLDLSGAETITGNWVNTANPWADNEVADNLTISGGSIENTAIGASAPSGGTFTSFRLTGGSEDQVLTYNADGNASWQNAAGGGGGALPSLISATMSDATDILIDDTSWHDISEFEVELEANSFYQMNGYYHNIRVGSSARVDVRFNYTGEIGDSFADALFATSASTSLMTEGATSSSSKSIRYIRAYFYTVTAGTLTFQVREGSASTNDTRIQGPGRLFVVKKATTN